jgi:hypothetical protein
MNPNAENLSHPTGRDAETVIADSARGQTHIEGAGAATAAAPAMQQDGRGGTAVNVAEESSGTVPYFSAGKAFTAWFNSKLAQLTNPSITLGDEAGARRRAAPGRAARMRARRRDRRGRQAVRGLRG